jgi:hypothetical protein
MGRYASQEELYLKKMLVLIRKAGDFLVSVVRKKKLANRKL